LKFLKSLSFSCTRVTESGFIRSAERKIKLIEIINKKVNVQNKHKRIIKYMYHLN